MSYFINKYLPTKIIVNPYGDDWLKCLRNDLPIYFTDIGMIIDANLERLYVDYNKLRRCSIRISSNKNQLNIKLHIPIHEKFFRLIAPTLLSFLVLINIKFSFISVIFILALLHSIWHFFSTTFKDEKYCKEFASQLNQYINGIQNN